MASPADRADHLEHAQRAGIPIGGGQPVVDHQNLSTRVRLLTMSMDKPDRCVRRLGMSGQAFAPTVAELCLVDELIRLDTGSYASPRRQALVMDDPGKGLIDDLLSCVANLEGEVGILVVCGFELRVKAAKVLEEGSAHHQAGPGAVVHLASEVVLGVVGVVELAVVPAAGVVPDHAPGLLKPAIGIEQLGTGEPRAGYVVKGTSQGLEPARRHQSIVIEKNQKLSPGRRRSTVARTDESQVHIVSKLDQALDPPEHLWRLVGRAVIDHDYLVG